MSVVLRRLAPVMAAAFAVAAWPPASALAEGTGPRYTYVGAGYEWSDSKCAYEPTGSSLEGYTAEASVGLFSFLHVNGSFYDGETSRPESSAGKAEPTCYELGAGLHYGVTDNVDLLLNGYWVSVDADNTSFDDDGFSPELGVRAAISDKAEIQVSMAYYDIGDVDNTEIRAAVVYNILPWLALRAGGTIFDDDSSLQAGIRAYFGDSLF